MKKGDKYIIEIAEVHTHYDDNGKAYPMARIKGFSALTFDQKGLDMLEKYEVHENVIEELLNCKFVVTKTKNNSFEVGEIYEVIDGEFSHKGSFFPINCKFHTQKELVNYLGSGDARCGSYNFSNPTEIIIIKE